MESGWCVYAEKRRQIWTAGRAARGEGGKPIYSFVRRWSGGFESTGFLSNHPALSIQAARTDGNTQANTQTRKTMKHARASQRSHKAHMHPKSLTAPNRTQEFSTHVNKISNEKLKTQRICTQPFTKIIARLMYTIHHGSLSHKWVNVGAKTLPAIEAWGIPLWQFWMFRS